MSETIYRISSWLMAIMLVVNSLPWPTAATAQTPDLPDPLNDLATSGEIYMDGVIGATGASFELMQLLETINLTPLPELDEAVVQQAREKALESAEQAARAQGAVTPLADAVQQLSQEFPTPVDALAEAQTFYADLPDETVGELHTLGMSDADIAALSTGVVDKAETRVDIQQNGLPASVEAQLVDAGFTTDEIVQIEASFQQRGVLRPGLATRMAQFRATQDELSNARTQAIIVYVQLLRYQIAARQAAGIAPRAPIDAELEELTQNEVRLLTHIGHLNDLMGSGANPDAGEGEWWAIERYSTRAVEQIDTLIVETQNLGLIVDLFVMMNIRTAAITAQAGDPVYAKAEADDLANLLAYLTGDDQLVSGDRARYARVPWWNNLPVLSSLFDVSVARAADDMALEMTQTRLEAGSAAENLALQAAGAGQIAESDEDNNVSSLIFSVGMTTEGQLTPDLIQSILDSISGVTPQQVGEFLWAVLSGQTDNWVALALNMGLSMIPVIGTIPDIISLIVDPNMLAKAMSVFGIVGSLGDLIALLPAPVAAQVTGATSAIVDATSTIIKALIKVSTSPFIKYLDDIPFKSAFKIGWDLIQRGITNGLKVLNGIPFPKSLDEVMPILDDVFNGHLWGPFTEYLGFAGRHGDEVYEFSEVSALIGRILDLKLGDEAAEAVQGMLGIATRCEGLSDDAVRGLTKLLPDGSRRALADRLFANVTDDAVLEKILVGAKNWDDAAESGFAKLVNAHVSDDTLTAFLAKYADDPVTSQRITGIVGNSTLSWNEVAFQNLEKVVDKYKVTNPDVIQHIDSLKNINGIDKVLLDLAERTDVKKTGALFQLELANSNRIGASNIQELAVTRPSGAEGPDFILTDGSIVEAKSYDWADLEGKPFLINGFVSGNLGQISANVRDYPGAPIVVIFRGSQPNFTLYPNAKRIVEGYMTAIDDGVNLMIEWYP